MSILVVAEHDNKNLKPSVLNTITAAEKLGGDISLLVAGHHCQAVAEQGAKIAGVKRVLLADHVAYAHHLAENLAALVAELAGAYSHILTAATTNGKNFMPRVAAIRDVAQISDVVQILSEDTFVQPMYAGNVLATVLSQDALKIMTVRSTAFPAAANRDEAAPIENCDTICDLALSEFVSQELTVSERPELTAARVVVSGGRGLQSGENFKMLETLADSLGGAIGASRAAVDAGFVPNDYQVGQTGKVVAPELYIAVGISGAIQHVAGMKDSKVIVAINKDEDAPIFQIATYCLVGDLFKIVPELNAELSEVKTC